MAPREVGFVLCMHTEPTTEPPCPTMLSVILRWLRKVEAIGFIGLFPICQSFSNCGSRPTGGSQNPSTWVYPFIQAISIAPLQVHDYSEALPTQHGYCVGRFTPKRHRQLRVKDLSKVSMWRPEWDSNPRPFLRKATNLPMSHHAPQF